MSKKFSITIIEAPDQNQRENPNNQFSNSEPMTFTQKVEYVKSIDMTNNKQQTAVEILCGKLAMKLGMPQAITFYIDHQEEIKEAKEMEKERTINFTEDWYFNGPLLGEGIDVKNTIEQHFNNTYGGGEQ
jgi:hypothetical protein